MPHIGNKGPPGSAPHPYLAPKMSFLPWCQPKSLTTPNIFQVFSPWICCHSPTCFGIFFSIKHIHRISCLLLWSKRFYSWVNIWIAIFPLNCFKIIKNRLNLMKVTWTSSWICSWKLLFFTTSILSRLSVEKIFHMEWSNALHHFLPPFFHENSFSKWCARAKKYILLRGGVMVRTWRFYP